MLKNYTKSVLGLIAFSLTTSVSAFKNNQPLDDIKGKVKDELVFTENKGQVADQNHKARPDVLFSGSSDGLVYHLRNNGVSYQLNRVDIWKSLAEMEGRSSNAPAKFQVKVPFQTTVYRLDINSKGINNDFTVETEKQKASVSNYYLENASENVQNLNSYEGVYYRNIYNNVDLHYYQKENSLKYDYIVKPGADYKQIKLEVKGAEKIKVEKDACTESLYFQKAPHPEFAPYLATIEEQDKKFEIISDSTTGERVYPYLNRLFPEYLKTSSRNFDIEGNEILAPDPSTELNYQQYKLLIPQPDIFTTFIPRPQIFYDVLYPSLAQHFTERWIHNVIFNGKDWKNIKSSYGFEPFQDFTRFNNLYELFDLYYLKGKTLFCIDVKAWSLASGNRLSQKTLDKAQRKLVTISQEYPEFTTVKGLLLNLHATEEKSHQ